MGFPKLSASPSRHPLLFPLPAPQVGANPLFVLSPTPRDEPHAHTPPRIEGRSRGNGSVSFGSSRGAMMATWSAASLRAFVVKTIFHHQGTKKTQNQRDKFATRVAFSQRLLPFDIESPSGCLSPLIDERLASLVRPPFRITARPARLFSMILASPFANNRYDRPPLRQFSVRAGKKSAHAQDLQVGSASRRS